MERQRELVPYFNDRYDRDPNSKEKFDYLIDEEMMHTTELTEAELDSLFVENTIKNARRYVSQDQDYISRKELNFFDLKSRAMFELGRGKLIINNLKNDDRVRVSFYSGINEPTSTNVKIPIYLSVEFIL